MGWSLKLGSVFGIDIKVHFTFVLVLIWGAFSYGGSAGPIYGVGVTLALFVLVLLHEMGHSLTAMAYGIQVKDIILLPIGGVARLERMPEKPQQELLVALAGPAVNVALAAILLPVVFGLSSGQNGLFSVSALVQPGAKGLLTFLLGANISLAIFNLIPAFPLDGGRVLRSLLGFFVDYHKATKIAVAVGRIAAVGLGVYGILNGQYFLALIALFIFTASGYEGQAVAARSVLQNIQVRQTLTPSKASLPPDATVSEAASLARTANRLHFAVVDPASLQLLGVVYSSDISQATERLEWSAPIVQIMRSVQNVPVVTLNTPLTEVQEKLTQASSRVAAVYDGTIFQGLISWDDLRRAFHFLSRGANPDQRPALERPV